MKVGIISLCVLLNLDCIVSLCIRASATLHASTARKYIPRQFLCLPDSGSCNSAVPQSRLQSKALAKMAESSPRMGYVVSVANSFEAAPTTLISKDVRRSWFGAVASSGT